MQSVLADLSAEADSLETVLRVHLAPTIASIRRDISRACLQQDREGRHRCESYLQLVIDDQARSAVALAAALLAWRVLRDVSASRRTQLHLLLQEAIIPIQTRAGDAVALAAAYRTRLQEDLALALQGPIGEDDVLDGAQDLLEQLLDTEEGNPVLTGRN